MNVFKMVEDIVAQIREADQPMQGRWQVGFEVIAVARPESDTIRVRYPVVAQLPFTADEWLSHPAVVSLSRTARTAHTREFDAVELAPWVLDDGALDAVVAAEVDPDYARAAHRAGVTDAWQLIEAWRNGILVEFLSALGGAA
ncbi:hypothetical protein [Microbacterium sp. MRS-1]|uniref:hypothetical protein n=1 Tax=Microbacterium sp. MRS-1 TaxID=1451261 RepID=UPI00044F55F5|nr:hypothetical protein [Microbacterium sp. MRS-1]EXJ50772.1 hypothetical protein AS96_13105 [Microbacterium sp. MRS-1]